MGKNRVLGLVLLAALGPACNGSGGGTTVTSTGGGGAAPTTILTATPLGPSSIALSWTNPAAGTSALDVTSTVLRNGGVVVDTHGFSYVDTNLGPNTRCNYQVVVTATYFFIGTTSNTWPSNTVPATTPADVTAPSVPGTVRIQPLSSSALRVTWEASTDDVGVADYRVFRDGAYVATCTSTSYDDASLAGYAEYTYTVTARDSSGNESAPSTPVGGRTFPAGTIVDDSTWSNALALDSAGAPHLVYTKRIDAVTYETRHATDAGGPWAIETIAGLWGYATVAVDPADRLHVATHGAYLTNAGGSWVQESLQPGSVVPSIAVDPGGVPHVAYQVETGGNPRFYVNFADRGGGSWTPETLENPPVYPYPVLRWGADGPRVAYCRGDFAGNYTLVNAAKVGGVWALQDVAQSTAGAAGFSLGGTPSMALPPAGGVLLTVGNVYATNASGSWMVEMYDPEGSIPALALDSAGTPWIAYKTYDAGTQTYFIKVAKRGTGGWVSSVFTSVAQPADRLALVIDAAGRLHLSYTDGNLVYYRVP